MNFGALIIGDEILSGKRQDKHFARLATIMAKRGLRLSWVSYLGDDRERLTGFLRRSFDGADVVFSFGGIGNTPDDHTRQAAAAALGVPLLVHPEGERELLQRFGGDLTPQRLQLVAFPEGAAIVPNPFNRVPGFSLRNHFFVPGFPQMAWPMVEWVLETHFSEYFVRQPSLDRALLLSGPQAYESALLDLMEAIVAEYPDLRLFSLPSIGEDRQRRHLELGVEGAPERVDSAIERIRVEVEKRGIDWRERDEPLPGAVRTDT